MSDELADVLRGMHRVAMTLRDERRRLYRAEGVLELTPIHEPPPPPQPHKRNLVGGNVAGFAYWDMPRLTVNMLRQAEANGFKRIDDWSRPVECDEHGDPLHDFQFILHWLETGGRQLECKARARGYVAASDIVLGDSRVTVQWWNYYPSKNVTTFVLQYASEAPFGNITISFRNTRSMGGPAGKPDTGLAELQIAHPGYSIEDIDTKVWTDEAIEYFAQCRPAPLRMMDLIGTNNATYTWATAQRDSTTRIGPPTWEMACELCNRTGCDLYFQIPHSFADEDADAAFDLIEAHVDRKLRRLFGFSNELWNSLFSQCGEQLVKCCLEVHGFVGGLVALGHDRGFDAWRTHGVVIIRTHEPHQLADGATTWWSNFDGMGEGDAVQVRVVTPTVFAFKRPGADGQMPVSSSHWFISNLQTNLLHDENDTKNVYNLVRRFNIRRLLQLHERCRARVGDEAMGSRWFAIWEDQMVDNNADEVWGDPPLRYVERQFHQRKVREWIGGLAGAPYFFAYPVQEVSGVQVQDVVDALGAVVDQNGQAAHIRYRFEGRACTAKYYGLPLGSVWYEGGPDTKAYTLNGEDLAVRSAAQFDPGIEQPCLDYIQQHQMVGGGFVCWYTLGFLKPTDQNREVVWGVTDALDHLDTPKLTAMSHARLMPVPQMIRNRIDRGPVDCRYTQDVYTVTNDTPAIKLDSKQKVPVYWGGQQCEKTLTIAFDMESPSGQEVDIYVNEVKQETVIFTTGSQTDVAMSARLDPGLNVVGFYPHGNCQNIHPISIEVLS